MPDDDNPLADLSPSRTADELRDELPELEYTNQDLEAHLTESDYDAEQVKAFRDVEQDRADGARKGAMEVIDEQFDVASSGPQIEEAVSKVEQTPDDSDVSVATPVADDDQLRMADGGGATASGVVSVELPSPYVDDAPQTVRVVIPKDMGFAGEFFDEGVYDVAYAEPNSSDVDGMRVKRYLESPQSIIRLSEDDPYHPNYEDGSESTPADHIVG